MSWISIFISLYLRHENYYCEICQILHLDENVLAPYDNNEDSLQELFLFNHAMNNSHDPMVGGDRNMAYHNEQIPPSPLYPSPIETRIPCTMDIGIADQLNPIRFQNVSEIESSSLTNYVQEEGENIAGPSRMILRSSRHLRNPVNQQQCVQNSYYCLRSRTPIPAPDSFSQISGDRNMRARGTPEKSRKKSGRTPTATRIRELPQVPTVRNRVSFKLLST